MITEYSVKMTNISIPEFLYPLEVSNENLVINICAALARLEEVNGVEICNVHSPRATPT